MLAKKHNASYSTVRRIVKESIPEKKKEKSFSEYIEAQTGEFYKLLDLYLEILGSREKLEASPINQIASAFGTIIEKFTAINGAGDSRVSKFEKILDELKGKKNE